MKKTTILAGSVLVALCVAGLIWLIIPKERSEFDAQRADVTFRWLAKEGKAMRAGWVLEASEAKLNPLRNNGHEAALQEFARIGKLGEKFESQKIQWKAKVDKITSNTVWFSFDPHEIVEEGVTGKAWCSDSKANINIPEQIDGILIINEAISFKHAQQLVPGDYIIITGTVEKFQPRRTQDGAGNVNARVEIYLKNCKASPL